MKFESRFDIGQSVYFIGAFNWPNRYLMVGGPATIGQIRIVEAAYGTEEEMLAKTLRRLGLKS